jgi:hypothetical protein
MRASLRQARRQLRRKMAAPNGSDHVISAKSQAVLMPLTQGFRNMSATSKQQIAGTAT